MEHTVYRAPLPGEYDPATMSDLVPPNSISLAPGVDVPESRLRWKFSRGSGPGGQNVNKVNTRAELWISLEALAMLSASARTRLVTLAGRRLTDAGEIHLVSSEHRSQEANRSAVIERLSQLIRLAMVEPKLRRKTRPSRGSKQRRIESKKRRGEIKRFRRSGGHD